jgi:hypothetical protein
MLKNSIIYTGINPLNLKLSITTNSISVMLLDHLKLSITTNTVMVILLDHLKLSITTNNVMVMLLDQYHKLCVALFATLPPYYSK